MNNETLIANVLANMTEGQEPALTTSEESKASSSATAPNCNKPSDDSLETEAEKKRRCNKRTKRVEHPLASVVQVVNKPREYMNHSYNDFSTVPAEVTDTFPEKIEDMTFAQKVHHILSQDKFSKWVSWLPHGRSFKVHVPAVFEREVLLKYFGHKRYSSFLRQLNNHGFKHITKGNDRNSYYHECMLRGMPHLCKFMPEPRDARRLIPDPDNEPDFYAITKNFPLPDMKAAAPVVNVMAAAAVGLNPQIPSLHNRHTSDISWLMEQMPAAKRMRHTMSELPPNLALQLQQQNQATTPGATQQMILTQIQAQLQAAAAAQQQQQQQQQQTAVNHAPVDPLIGLRLAQNAGGLNGNAFAALLASQQQQQQQQPQQQQQLHQRSPSSLVAAGAPTGQSNGIPDALAALLLGSQHFVPNQS